MTVSQSTSKPRRLTVVQLIPALHAGGAERSVLEIARALVADGHRSVVVSAGGRMVGQLQDEGSEHVTLDIGRKSLLTLFAVRRLRAVLRELDADIVHARSRLPAWIGRLALRGMHPAPHFVTTVHGLNSPGRYSRVMISGERVIAVSQTVRDYVITHYLQTDPSRLVVIPRGVDTDAFPYGYRPDDEWTARFRRDFPGMTDAPLLVLPGRGTRLKGHHDALELVDGLRVRGVQTQLLLLGVIEPGREAYVEELRTLITRRKLGDRVFLSAARDDVRDVFASAALILQLSNKPEAFGRTVVEALALCRPVLGYAHGGVGELLSELYPAGRVPPMDTERLIERAAELLRLAPPIPPLERYRLLDMQRDTLALYRSVAGSD